MYPERLTQIIETVHNATDPSDRPIIISGEAGTGKTSLLWQLYTHFQSNSNYFPVLLKAVHLKLIDVEAYLTDFNPKGSRLIVLIDTLDLLLHNEQDRERVTMLLAFFRRRQIMVISSCRPQELADLKVIKSLGIKEYVLGDYSEDVELPKAIEKYAAVYCKYYSENDGSEVVRKAINSVADSRPLKSICLRPLTSRMLFSLYTPDDLPQEINVFSLYQQYWHNKIEKDSRHFRSAASTDDINLAESTCSIALLMLAEGSITLSDSGLNFSSGIFGIDKRDIDLLADRSVLFRSAGSIEFFHQTFFEHAAARALLTRFQKGSLELLGQRLEQYWQDDSGYSYFISPIYEQLLLLLTNATPAYRSAGLASLREMLASSMTDKIRSAIYVYAMLEEDDEISTIALERLFSANNPKQTVYIKRFLQAAVNMNEKRLPVLFHLLELIWDRGVWNEQYNLLELLDYLSRKQPKQVLRLIQSKEICRKVASESMKAGKQQHQPIVAKVVEMLLRLHLYDKTYMLEGIGALIRSTDPVAITVLVEYVSASSYQDIRKKVLQQLMDVAVAQANETSQIVKATAKLCSMCWLDEGVSLGDITTQINTEEHRVRVILIQALSHYATKLEANGACSLFQHFRQIRDTEEIFMWVKNFIRPLQERAPHEITPLEQLIREDIDDLFARQLDGMLTGRDNHYLKAYKTHLAKQKTEAFEKVYALFKNYLLNPDILLKNEELIRLLFTAHTHGIIEVGSFIRNQHMFIHSHKLSRKVCSIINEECLLADDFLALAAALSMTHGFAKMLASILERLHQKSYKSFERLVSSSDGLMRYKDALTEFAISLIKTSKVPQITDGSHLLLYLIKLGVTDQMPFQELQKHYQKEKRVDVLSWALDLYPFALFHSSQEVEKALSFCRDHFTSDNRNVRNKARCAYLTIVLNSPFALTEGGDALADIYIRDLKDDTSDQRIKVINRILTRYAPSYPDEMFILFNAILKSESYQTFPPGRQKEVRTELLNGCVAVCRNATKEQLSTLIDYLKAAPEEYGRLLVYGLGADKALLMKSRSLLMTVSSDSGTHEHTRTLIQELLKRRMVVPRTDVRWEGLLEAV